MTKWPVLGMLPAFLHNLSNIHNYLSLTLKQNGGTFYFEGPWLTNLDTVFTSDARNVQHITSTKFANYGKGNHFREIFDILGEGIFRSDSDIWKYNRTLLHSIFKQESFRAFIQKTVEEKVSNGLLVFLDNACKEGVQVDLQDVFQRLYPPIPLEHKCALEPDVLPSGHRIKSNATIVYSLYAIGRVEEIWGKDCLEFKPERWISPKGGIVHVPSYKFIAFNAGPRSCLGKDISFIELKIVAAAILSNYHIQVVEDHPIIPSVSVVLHMKDGLMVNVKKRSI
ncbi:hypothetical protein TSUD_167200 [Trifolium subterraneum]|nr:hypothetical protein TSUD_167200 [Trifolium subterraneum]